MADLVTFVPKVGVEAEQNLDAFIRMCREQLTLFSDQDGFDWNSYEWPGFKLARLGNGNKGVAKEARLDKEFAEFARAYFRYKQSHNPNRYKSERYALISIEAALRSVTGAGRVSGVSKAVLDEAARLAADYYSSGIAYSIGRELRNLARFLEEKNLVAAHVGDWKSPLKRPNDRRNTGAAGREVIDSKLPSNEAVMAMGEMFANDPDDPLTIFCTSVWALLMGTGFRIGELLDLKVDAEVSVRRDDGEPRYGLRYEGEKGWGSDIKWVEKTYTEVCKEAFRRLLKLSEPARRFALHMESQPETPYLWDGLQLDDVDQPFSLKDLLGIWGSGYADLGLRAGDSFRDCHKKVALDGLPQGFPEPRKLTDASPTIKWSESLFCLRANELHGRRRTLENRLWRPDKNTLNFALGPRPSVKSHMSVFDRHGYRMPDGSLMKITSHQARHFLNTVAERGGMLQDDIARFFGRADPKQNRAYNHMTDAELVQKAESLNREIKLFGADEQVRMRLPVSTVEFNALVDRMPVHATEYGVCVHDYTMSPCDKFRDCINCTEQVCVKGNDSKLARLKVRLDHEERQLQAHVRAMAEQKVGADRWYQHAIKTVARLRELVEILESDQVEEGAVIKLRNEDEHSHLGRAVAMRMSEDRQLEKQRDEQEQALALVSQFEMLVGEK